MFYSFQSISLSPPWLFIESESDSHSVMPNSLWPHRLYSPWNSPSQNTGVDSLSFLQRIFSTQGLNPGLPHCRWTLYQLSYQGIPWVFITMYFYFLYDFKWFLKNSDSVHYLYIETVNLCILIYITKTLLNSFVSSSNFGVETVFYI